MFILLLVYNLLLPIGIVLSLPLRWNKMRKRGGYAENWRERLACYDAQTLSRLGKPCWWIHAVSVGEILMALKLIAELRKSNIWSGPISLTTTTSTGRKLGKDRADSATTVLWTPLDLPWISAKAIRTIKPLQLILVESEIWPNLVFLASIKNIPVSIVNARLSPRSEKRYKALSFFSAPLFKLFHKVCVQDPRDGERFVAIGVPPERIVSTGAIKFDEDAEPEPTALKEIEALADSHPAIASRRILLAASTHAGEEAMLAKAWLALRPDFPDTALVVVPRHFERCDEVEADLISLGLTPARRTAAPTDASDCLIVDKTGELRAWYHVATIVVVGKSFLDHAGGQNPAEPVRAGRPTITGPRMDNFTSLMQTLTDARGILQIPDEESLVPTLRTLLSNPEECDALAMRGHQSLAMHNGATHRTALALLTKSV